ncbi:MAG: hypothetical protein WCG73_03045, partial [Candidatus Moraniibacteriota bacterium]
SIKDASGSSYMVYVMSDRLYAGNIFQPGAYIAKQSGYDFIQTIDITSVPKGAPVFFLTENSGDYHSLLEGVPVKNVKNFGAMRVYQLEY